MTMAKNIYKSTKRNLNYVQWQCVVKHESSVLRGETSSDINDEVVFDICTCKSVKRGKFSITKLDLMVL